jgi:hypothetical protein
VVVVQLQGGLGNQLFQISAGYWLARHYEASKLFLDASRIPFGTDNSRRFELLNFNLFPPNFELEVWGKSLSRISRARPARLGAFAALAASKINSRIKFRGYSNYVENISSIPFENLKENSILNGYFNDFSIVEKAREAGLSNKLVLSGSESNWLLDKMKSIDFDSCVAIHVRLGDYLRFPRIFGRLTEDYYSAALEAIGISKNQQILIFSDQPNLAANYLPKISNRKNCEIIRHPEEVPSYEILFLMSQFRSIVCANSTFSMWAAWFNQGVGPEEKRVAIPTPYLLDRADMVTPATWHKIPRD